MDETYLIEQAKKGDVGAYNTLVLHYQDAVYNVAYRIMGEPGAAADASQEAFISAYKALRRFRGGNFKSWLMRIVTNACYDELRRKKRRPTTPLEPVDDEGNEIESPHWIADADQSPEDNLDRIELADAIQSCLDQLSEDFRVVVVLVDVQGFDYLEASEVIGKPLGTIKSRLARARNRMQECLQDFWELLPHSMRLES